MQNTLKHQFLLTLIIAGFYWVFYSIFFNNNCGDVLVSDIWMFNHTLDRIFA